MKGTYLNITEFGTPQKVIQIASKELRQPRENDVLVRMIARPVNPSDLKVYVHFLRFMFLHIM